jgi:fumarate reductase flavoprotein subunit
MSKKINLLFLFLFTGMLSVSAASALDAKKPLAELHKEAGLTCDACHGNGPKKPPTMTQCLGCHESYAKVAERTKNLEPNPHDNHLIDLECTKCHLGHKAQVIYCRTCHSEMEFVKK